MNSNTGSATLTGQFLGTLFKSTSPFTGGSAYVELGQTGAFDPTDELRMFNGGRVSSIRNPSDRPGVARISTAEFASSAVYNFGYYGFETPNSIMSVGLGTSQTISLNSSSGIVLSPYGSSIDLRVTTQNGGTSAVLLATAGTGSSIKLLTSAQVQARNASDTAYVTLVASNLAASSAELKKNITPLEINATQSLSQVKLRAWDWKNDDSGSGQIGFLLEDLPVWATIDEDAFNMSTVVAMCAQAIGELNQRISELENGNG
jgi:hypothetical protein